LVQQRGLKLLIVETEDAFRRNMSDRLRLRKCSVLEANDEASAKRIVQRKDIDVVLLGLEGFGYRGLSLLKAIKEIRPLAEVILINPLEELALSIEGMKLGAFDDLWVPFEMETLLERIHQAYRRKQENKKAAYLKP
jgi:DNA-binding NtrC family response regulator